MILVASRKKKKSYRFLTLAMFLLFVSVLCSCKKEHFDIHNLNDNKIGVLGHGGMGIGQAYPMNSLESIYKCLSLGAEGTEIDVQMTKDSVLVAFHDEQLQTSTNASGWIYQNTWDEIHNTIYTISPYTDYRLTKLEDIFAHIDNPTQYTFFLDCKNFKPDTSSAYVNTFNRAILNVIDKYQLQHCIYVELKREDLIKSLQEKRPDLKMFAYGGFETSLETAQKYGILGLTTSVDEISKEEVQKAHDNGIMVAVFNTHSKKRNIQAINKNVDFIQTDKVKHLIKLLK